MYIYDTVRLQLINYLPVVVWLLITLIIYTKQYITKQAFILNILHLLITFFDTTAMFFFAYVFLVTSL